MVRGAETIIGLGVDIVELDRFREAWSRRGQRLLERLFTPHEQRRCLERADPVPELAARFAAKEATFKAIGTGWRQGVRWVDVEVRNAPSGRPYLMVVGRVAEIARSLGGHRFSVSLSHSRRSALAQVVLLGSGEGAGWLAQERLGEAADGSGS